MDSHLIGTLVATGLGAAAIVAILRQCRRPSWWPGRFFIWTMNIRHAGVTGWGLDHVRIEPEFDILDVGCGGGRTIRTLAAKATRGTVCGVDYSSASVAAAKRMNRALIQEGRVEIQHASVSRLPYPERRFDLVTAVETHYYWPDPVTDLREILRVLKPGGRLIIIAETYRGERFDRFFRVVMRLLRARYLTVREHEELFTTAGYADVAVFEESTNGWICVVGRKRQGDGAAG